MSASPPTYTRQANFTSFEAVYPSSPKSGVSLDAEFNALRTTVLALISRLAEIQRDDGALGNGVVHPDAFTADALALIGADLTPRGDWATDTVYDVRDMVRQGGVVYIAIEEHLSGTFADDLAAGKWQSMASAAAASSISVTPAGNIGSSNVQAALEELDSDIGGKQSTNANLTALAALTLAADKLAYATGVGGLALTDLTTLARTLLACASTAAMRSALAAAGTAVANTFTADQTLSFSDDGATAGPALNLTRVSASPAASDLLGVLAFLGRDSLGNAETYAKVLAQIIDPTSASEDAVLDLQTVIAGTLASRLLLGAGLYMTGATGGDKGAGTINATAFYTSGVKGAPVDYIEIRDEKAAGTDGGGFTSGAWQTRTLNTEHADAGGHASVSSNQITLAAGTYEVDITCPAGVVADHQARLRNITDSATTLVGTSEYTGTGNTTFTRSRITGRFTIAASKVFEVQHRCTTTKSTNGFGDASNFGETEVYTVARFWKVG